MMRAITIITLLALAATGFIAQIARAVKDRLAAFRGDARQVDDVTFVVVKVPPGAG